jgi:hypothetical protein
MEVTMAEEAHTVKSESGEKSGASPWLAFFVGALLIAVVALFFTNAHGTFSGPGGRAEINVGSPVTLPANPAPATPAPAK